MLYKDSELMILDKLTKATDFIKKKYLTQRLDLDPFNVSKSFKKNIHKHNFTVSKIKVKALINKQKINFF